MSVKHLPNHPTFHLTSQDYPQEKQAEAPNCLLNFSPLYLVIIITINHATLLIILTYLRLGHEPPHSYHYPKDLNCI